MDDLISREVVLDTLKTLRNHNISAYEYDKWILGIESAQNWVPISQARPKESCVCWVTYKVGNDVYVDDDLYDGNEFMGHGNVIAWYQVPTEPYKGE